MPIVVCGTAGNIAWKKGPDWQLGDDYAHIWRLWLPASSYLIIQAHILTADEHQRAARYHSDADRYRFICSRVALRNILSHYTNIRPEDITFYTGENKKPGIAGNDNLFYNVSHSGDCVLFAVAGSPVGVDTEAVNKNLDIQDIAASCFSPGEQHAVTGAVEFYKIWTRKEALLKCTGKGIDDDITDIPALDGRHAVNGLFTGSDKDIYVDSFEPFPGYKASVATAGKTNYKWFDF